MLIAFINYEKLKPWEFREEMSPGELRNDYLELCSTSWPVDASEAARVGRRILHELREVARVGLGALARDLGVEVILYR